MTVDVVIRCDACRASVVAADVLTVWLDARRSLEACSDACAVELRRRHGVVAPAPYAAGAAIGARR